MDQESVAFDDESEGFAWRWGRESVSNRHEMGVIAIQVVRSDYSTDRLIAFTRTFVDELLGQQELPDLPGDLRILELHVDLLLSEAAHQLELLTFQRQVDVLLPGGSVDERRGCKLVTQLMNTQT